MDGRLLIENHLDQSLSLANEKTRTSTQIIFITFFPGRCTLLIAFFAPRQTVQICLLKTIFPSTSGMCRLFYIQFYSVGPHTEDRWGCSFTDYMTFPDPVSLRKVLWEGRSEILLSSYLAHAKPHG